MGGREWLFEFLEEQSADDPAANSFEARLLNFESGSGSGNNSSLRALLNFHDAAFNQLRQTTRLRPAQRTKNGVNGGLNGRNIGKVGRTQKSDTKVLIVLAPTPLAAFAARNSKKVFWKRFGK